MENLLVDTDWSNNTMEDKWKITDQSLRNMNSLFDFLDRTEDSTALFGEVNRILTLAMNVLSKMTEYFTDSDIYHPDFCDGRFCLYFSRNEDHEQTMLAPNKFPTIDFQYNLAPRSAIIFGTVDGMEKHFSQMGYRNPLFLTYFKTDNQTQVVDEKYSVR